MKRNALFGVIMAGAMAFGIVTPVSGSQSKDDIKQQIIDSSIESYPGNCPCPYNSMRNGRQCGGRSAWSKEGGYSPICYKREVTDEMVKEWMEGHS